MSLSLLRETIVARARHVSPFLVLGDPTPEISFALALRAIGDGATMLELGFPYDAACADGPEIQAADARALAAGVSTDAALRLLARIRAARPRVPLNLLVYANLVHARGFDRFVSEAAGAGASSLLVPDVPLEEGAALRARCRKAGLGVVQMAGPFTPLARLRLLDAACDAFLYLAGRQGVTGIDGSGAATGPDLVARTAASVNRPLCVGFGLSREDQIAPVLAAGAAIAVVGSALARVIGAAWSEPTSDRDAGVVDCFSAAFRPMAGAAIQGDPSCS
jgi:tryptophan synthase alpha chain